MLESLHKGDGRAESLIGSLASIGMNPYPIFLTAFPIPEPVLFASSLLQWAPPVCLSLLPGLFAPEKRQRDNFTPTLGDSVTYFSRDVEGPGAVKPCSFSPPSCSSTLGTPR